MDKDNKAKRKKKNNLKKQLIKSSPKKKEQIQNTCIKELNYLFEGAKVVIMKVLPQIGYYMSSTLYNIYNIIFLKFTYNSALIAGFGLGMTFLSLTCFIFIICTCSGALVPASQAFGAKNYEKVGRIRYQVMFVCFIFSIISCFLTIFADKILMFINIDQTTASTAQLVAAISLPVLFLNSYFDSLRYFLYSQKVYDVTLKTSIICYGGHGIWLIIFVSYLQLDVIGVAFSRIITLCLLCFSSYKLFYAMPNSGLCYYKFDFKTLFIEFSQFLKVSIPSGAPQIIPWMFVEIITLIVGQFQDPVMLATHIQLAYILSIFLSCTTAMQITINGMIGNEAGAQNKEKIIYYTKVAVFLCILFGIGYMIIALLGEDIFISLVCTGEENIKQFKAVYKIGIVLFSFLTCFERVLPTLITPLNKEKHVLIQLLIVNYAFGIPLIYFLSKTMGLKLVGVWISRCIVSIVNVVVFCFIRRSIDLDKTLQIIKKRNEKKLEQDKEQPLIEMNQLKNQNLNEVSIKILPEKGKEKQKEENV